MRDRVHTSEHLRNFAKHMYVAVMEEAEPRIVYAVGEHVRPLLRNVGAAHYSAAQQIPVVPSAAAFVGTGMAHGQHPQHGHGQHPQHGHGQHPQHGHGQHPYQYVPTQAIGSGSGRSHPQMLAPNLTAPAAGPKHGGYQHAVHQQQNSENAQGPGVQSRDKQSESESIRSPVYAHSSAMQPADTLIVSAQSSMKLPPA